MNLAYPDALLLDKDDNLIVSDHHSIKRVNVSTGEVDIIAGEEQTGNMFFFYFNHFH